MLEIFQPPRCAGPAHFRKSEGRAAEATRLKIAAAMKN